MKTDTVCARKKNQNKLLLENGKYWHNFDVFVQGKFPAGRWKAPPTAFTSISSSPLFSCYFPICRNNGSSPSVVGSQNSADVFSSLGSNPTPPRERTHIHTTSPTESLWVRRFRSESTEKILFSDRSTAPATMKFTNSHHQPQEVPVFRPEFPPNTREFWWEIIFQTNPCCDFFHDVRSAILFTSEWMEHDQARRREPTELKSRWENPRADGWTRTPLKCACVYRWGSLCCNGNVCACSVRVGWCGRVLFSPFSHWWRTVVWVQT